MPGCYLCWALLAGMAYKMEEQVAYDMLTRGALVQARESSLAALRCAIAVIIPVNVRDLTRSHAHCHVQNAMDKLCSICYVVYTHN